MCSEFVRESGWARESTHAWRDSGAKGSRRWGSMRARMRIVTVAGRVAAGSVGRSESHVPDTRVCKISCKVVAQY